MRFRSIEISNYRQYRNLKLEFFPGEHDLQLIIADNGVGKTNLLNAFTWCLHGEEPHLGMDQRHLAKQKLEPKLNKEVVLECLQSGVRSAQVSISVDIETSSGDKPRVMRATRTLPFSFTPEETPFERIHEETLTVVEMGPGTSGLYYEERAQKYIDKFLPQSIREYFFFDGEQLNNYFRATSGDKIKSAVYSIAQIDLFTTMAARLKTVIEDRRREATGMSTNTAQLEERKENAERTLAGALNVINENEKRIEKLKQQIEEIGDQLVGVTDIRGTEKRMQQLQQRCEQLRNALEKRRKEYYEFARSYAVDFYLYPLVEKSLNTIRDMQNSGQLPPTIDPLRLRQSLETGKCIVCEHEFSDSERAHVEELLEQFRISSETSNILSSMVNELQRSVDSIENYPKARSKSIADLNAAEDALESEESELRVVQTEAAAYADRCDVIKDLYDRRERFQEEVDELQRQIGVKQSVASRQEIEVGKLKKVINAELKKNEKAQHLNEMIDFGNRALKVLKDAESEVIQETRKQMAWRTEDLFRGLVWKESKCDHIELSENYTPSLYDKYGFSCAGTCSAAERSLLALSFTLAMHEVSGFDSPLFIDTPIARASGENRENFARTLVEISEGKQLILAFTPDEYSESIEREFEPAIATSIRLRLDEDESHVMMPEVDRRA